MKDVHKQKIAWALLGNKNGSGNKKDKIFKNCMECHKQFSVHPYRVNSSKYCSRKCTRNSQEISLERRQKMSLSMRGKNTKFGDGISVTPLRISIRGLMQYKIWRTHVFQRDEYCCQECKDSKGGNLNADHIIPFSTILQIYKIKTIEEALACEFLWDIRNGRTLCVPCHRKTPTYAGRGLSRTKQHG